MSDFGIKASIGNEDVSRVSQLNLSVGGKYPLWKCDMRPSPKHYGLLKCTVTLAPGARKTIFTLPHGYDYTPSFLVAWNYPAGNNTLSSSINQTFGLGTLEIFTSSFELVYFYALMDDKNFTIVADNSTGAQTYTDLYAEIRYYIFAERFNETIIGSRLAP